MSAIAMDPARANPTHDALPSVSRSGRVVDDQADDSERSYATLTHLMGLLTVIDVSGVVTAIIIGVLWWVRRQESPFLDDHGREALNFQISILLYIVISVVLGIVVSIVTLGIAVPLVMLAGGLLAVVVYVVRIVVAILAGLAARRGEFYRYPVTLRVIPTPREA